MDQLCFEVNMIFLANQKLDRSENPVTWLGVKILRHI